MGCGGLLPQTRQPPKQEAWKRQIVKWDPHIGIPYYHYRKLLHSERDLWGNSWGKVLYILG